VHHEEQAGAVVRAVADYDPTLPVLGLPGSAWLRLAEEEGLTVVPEAFADRAYTPEATLVSRRVPGAVLEDVDEIARRCVAMATGEPITDAEGGSLTVTAGSICVHGDTAGAVKIAGAVKDALTEAGVTVAPFAD
jgi:5-oxoprolinase (ATP-hydrolysing) subunit A